MVEKRKDSSCYVINDQPHCIIKNKAQGTENCTYLDPTNQIPYHDVQNAEIYFADYNITPKRVPIDVHIHGLEVRPTFDGNPLSWLGVDGSVGPGFQSMLNSVYYNLFKNSTNTMLTAN